MLLVHDLIKSSVGILFAVASSIILLNVILIYINCYIILAGIRSYARYIKDLNWLKENNWINAGMKQRKRELMNEWTSGRRSIRVVLFDLSLCFLCPLIVSVCIALSVSLCLSLSLCLFLRVYLRITRSTCFWQVDFLSLRYIYFLYAIEQNVLAVERQLPPHSLDFDFISWCIILPVCLPAWLIDWLAGWLTDYYWLSVYLSACFLHACLTAWLHAFLPACLTDLETDTWK